MQVLDFSYYFIIIHRPDPAFSEQIGCGTPWTAQITRIKDSQVGSIGMGRLVEDARMTFLSQLPAQDLTK
jgi:hypothetical protein